MPANQEITIDAIERQLKDPSCGIRAAALNACLSMDISPEVIKRWMGDSNSYVRQAAINYCNRHGLPIPVIRTFEPPEIVYKRCCDGKIVYAKVHRTAHVRGPCCGRCRCNKATITDVSGDDKTATSIYDDNTKYSPGDEVDVDDFDLSDEECAPGFHFFCTKEEAEKYRFSKFVPTPDGASA